MQLKEQNLTAAELAVETAPTADESEQIESETSKEDEAAKEDSA